MALKPSLLALALGLSWASALQAADLVTVYQHALDYDSELAAARATYQAQAQPTHRASAVLLTVDSADAGPSSTYSNSELIANTSHNSNVYSSELTQHHYHSDTSYPYQYSQFASGQAAAQ